MSTRRFRLGIHVEMKRGIVPLRRFVAGGASARRGGRYPGWAHTGSVCAALRLRCDARAGVAPRNSLRSLRSLSNSLGESDERSALRAPTAPLRFSPPHKSPTPGTAHRAAMLVVFVDEGHGGAGKAVGGYASAATYAAPRSGGLVAARVSALPFLTRRDCPSATNAVSEASFATGRETEYRRGVGPRGRPPHSSAGAYPPPALLARYNRAATRD